MNNLQNNTFRIIEQNTAYENYYSFILNELIKVRKDFKYSMDKASEAFNCSKGTIFNFENRIKDYDFVMLFKYAALFNYKITMFLEEMKYSEIMSL